MTQFAGWQFHRRLGTLKCVPNGSSLTRRIARVHVEREGSGGKFWLEPVRMALGEDMA
jgi:hypothetical protein